MPSTSWSLLLCLAALPTAGCQAALDEDQYVASADSDNIINGRVEDKDDTAVFFIESGRSGFQCTAFLVAPTILMTAGHCVHPDIVGSNQEFYVYTESRKTGHSITVKKAPQYQAALDPYHLQNGHDVAFLTLEDKDAINDIKPLTLHLDTLQNDFIGASVRVVGYGATDIRVTGDDTPPEAFGVGVRRTTTVPTFGYSPLSYDLGEGPNHTRTCVSDSGGPVLQHVGTEDIVVGVISFGDFACTASAAARIDVLRDYIESIVPKSAPLPTTAPESGVDGGTSEPAPTTN